MTLALRVFLRSASFAGLLTTLILVKSSSAQNGVTTAISEPEDQADPAATNVQLVGDDLPQGNGSEDFAPNTGDIDKEQPPDTALDSGLPLTVFLTPFHWGRFSLLSVTASEGYNSNPQFQKTPLGASVTSISTLALYSAQFAGWRMNLQYQPFIWISSRQTLKDFAAASLDIRTLRRINNSWHWTFGDRFRYAPTHSTEQTSGFVADPGGGVSIGNAFLSTGRNVLVNGIAGTLTDRYNENSTLTFHANQDYSRLSSILGGQPSNQFPVQQAITFSSGVTWRHHLSLKDTISTEYTYRLQTSTGASAQNVSSNAASVGWDHKLTTRLGVSASFGPAWSGYAGQQKANTSSRERTTVHGSLSLFKEFTHGGVVLGFVRSDSFSGIISNGFHNRYDFTAHREFSSRLHCSAAASYIQQENSNARSTTGELITAELRYFLSHNWAVFTQVRYFDTARDQRALAPEKSAVVGFHWSWVPEKP